MSNVDPAPEARGGGSFQRENLSDLDDVLTTGAWHLSDLAFNGTTGKWAYDGALGVPVLTAGATAQIGSSPTLAYTAGFGSTDGRQAVSLTTGTGALSAGVLFTVTFAQALPSGKLPYVDVQETNSAARALLAFPTAVTNAGFSVSFGSAAAASTLYTFVIKCEG